MKSGILLVMLSLVAAAQSPAPQLGAVQGSLAGLDTNAPLSHAAIVLRPLLVDGRAGRIIRGDADEKGEFVLSGVKPGPYVLSVERAGYSRVTYSQGGATFREMRLTVKAGETNSVRLRLMPLGVVAGTVSGSEGGPLAHARVMLGHYRAIDGARVLVPEREVWSDQNGTFRMTGIPAGQYLLSAFSRGERVYILTAAGAQPIQVEEGRTVEGLKLQLAAAAGFGIFGQVTDAAGAPVAGAAVLARRQAEDGVVNLLSSELQTVKTGAGGEFLLARMLPGKYRLSVTGGKLTGSSVVELGSGDLRGVRAVAGPGAAVTGRIVFEGNFQGNKAPVNPHLARVSAHLEVGSAPSMASAVIADDATFKIENVPEGSVRFRVGMANDRYYLQSIRWNGRDLMEQALEVRNDDRVDGVEVVISLNAAQLSGRVAPEAVLQPGAPPPVVILIPAQMVTPQARQRLTKVAHVNEAGQFTIRGIMPGEYGMVAVRGVVEGSESDPGLVAAVQSQAQPVTLAAGKAGAGILRAVDAPH